MLNPLIFSFIILNLVKKGILDFHVTTATDSCMKEVIESCPRRVLWWNIMEVLKALIFTKFSQQTSDRSAKVFTVLLYLQDSLRYK